MRNVTVAPATDDAAYYVATHMRAADVREVWALSHLTPVDAVMLSLRLTANPYVAYHRRKPIAVFGVHSNLLGDVGCPWLLGTDDVRKYAGDLMAGTKPFLEHYLTKHRRLENEVHAANRDAVRYLKWAGFTLSEVYRTHTGAEARKFWMERNDV